MNQLDTTGGVAIARITHIDTDTFRARVKYLEQGGSTQPCVFNPAGHGGHVPVEGEMCLVYRVGQFYARYLMPLGLPIDRSERSLQERIDKGEEGIGDLPKLMPGDTFMGDMGKIHLNRLGSVEMYTPTSGQRFALNNQTSKATLDAHNYTLSTMGKGISITTKSSLPSSMGDILRLEKNIPASMIPDEVLQVSIPSNLSLIELDALGGITASVLAGGEMSLSELGEAFIGNDLGGLTIKPTGDVRLKNPLATLEIDPLGDMSLLGPKGKLEILLDGSFILSGGVNVGSLTGSSAGILTMSSAAEMLVNAGTDLTVLSKTALLSSATSLTLASPTISLTGATTITGATLVTGDLALVGVFAPIGLPDATPLVGVTTVAKIAVLVNGVLAGFIPVIP